MRHVLWARVGTIGSALSPLLRIWFAKIVIIFNLNLFENYTVLTKT